MRKGRVLAQLSSNDEALSELNRVRERTTSDFLFYLASLFAGEILEKTNRASEAQDAYRGAIGRIPHAQSAYLAWSQILDRTGGAREATGVIEKLFLPRETAPDDPFWRYDMGQSWRLDEMLKALYGEVRS